MGSVAVGKSTALHNSARSSSALTALNTRGIESGRVLKIRVRLPEPNAAFRFGIDREAAVREEKVSACKRGLEARSLRGMRKHEARP